MKIMPFLYRFFDDLTTDYPKLPRRCRDCDVLGMCRDLRGDGRCYHGCLLIEQQYEGLPRRCRSCELLTECRRPISENWKCYNGCLILRRKEKDL